MDYSALSSQWGTGAGNSVDAGNASVKLVTISITTRTAAELSTKPPQRRQLRYIIYINTGTPMTDSQKTMLEMITSREQLMEDIMCIIESNFGEVEYKDEVITQLCDAVCNNFPVK